MKRFGLLLVWIAVALQAAAQAVAYKATASSEMKDPKYKYGAAQAIDGDLQTWWTPAPPNNGGKGQWLKIEMSERQAISGIKIVGGSHHPNFPPFGDLFPLNARLKEADLEFEDGTKERITLKDADMFQFFEFAERNSSYVIIKPVSTYPGKKWQDLCISEVQVVLSEGEQQPVGDAPVEWLGLIQQQIGVWLQGGPCPTNVYEVKRIEPELGAAIPRFVLMSYGVMDTQIDSITGAYASDGNTISISLNGGSTILTERTLVFGPDFTHLVAHAPQPGDVDRAFVKRYLVGRYQNEKGEAVIIGETSMTRGGRTFNYTYRGPVDMYSNCGVISFGDGDLALEIRGRDLYLFKVHPSNDGPDFTIETTPYRVYYRKD
jgi:hypothetical protein